MVEIFRFWRRNSEENLVIKAVAMMPIPTRNEINPDISLVDKIDLNNGFGDTIQLGYAYLDENNPAKSIINF